MPFRLLPIASALACLLLAGALCAPLAAAEPRDPALEARAERVLSRTQGPLSRVRIDTLKAVVATAGTALLLVGALAARRDPSRLHSRPRDALLLALGVTGALCWWNLLQLHYPGYSHPSENYHYFVGAKYFRELGYTRLYTCAAVAEAQMGLAEEAAGRRVRDLASNRIVLGSELIERPGECIRHFSKARWRAFLHDVGWFRTHLPDAGWARMQADHGYNATPVWGIAGSLLTNTGPVSSQRLLALGLIDVALLLILGVAVAWAFGWRSLCVAAIFWGTNYFAPYGWTGGGILRQDWLVATGVGICLLRRDRPFAGGFLLATAALLRIFPGFLLAGFALQAGFGMWRERRFQLSPEHRRLLAGGLVATALLVPLSMIVGGGAGVWNDFARNSALHLETPLRNNMGLPTLLSYEHDARAEHLRDASRANPYERWHRARSEATQRTRPLHVALVLGFLALLGIAVRDRAPWIAAVAGVGLVPIATQLTCYYFAILLVYAFLWPRRPAVGVALLGCAALSWAVADRFHYYDEIFTWQSALVLALAVFATEWVRRMPRDSLVPPAPGPAAAPDSAGTR